MSASVTVRLPHDLETELKKLSQQEKISKSEIIRNAVERYIAVKRFRQLRGHTLPFAEVQGLLTDEDIFNIVS